MSRLRRSTSRTAMSMSWRLSASAPGVALSISIEPEMLASGFAAVAASGVPYLLIAGAEPPPDLARWLSDAVPQMTIEVWADTGHFPHLAHPGRFAQRLAATGQWQAVPTGRNEIRE